MSLGGDERYNDVQCSGQGSCVEGVCVCTTEQFSGNACEIMGAFTPEQIDTLVVASSGKADRHSAESSLFK